MKIPVFLLLQRVLFFIINHFIFVMFMNYRILGWACCLAGISFFGSCAAHRHYSDEYMDLYLIWRDVTCKNLFYPSLKVFPDNYGYETLSVFKNENDWQKAENLTKVDKILVFQKDFIINICEPNSEAYMNNIEIYFRKNSSDSLLTTATIWLKKGNFEQDFQDYKVVICQNEALIYENDKLILFKKID